MAKKNKKKQKKVLNWDLHLMGKIGAEKWHQLGNNQMLQSNEPCYKKLIQADFLKEPIECIFTKWNLRDDVPMEKDNLFFIRIKIRVYNFEAVTAMIVNEEFIFNTENFEDVITHEIKELAKKAVIEKDPNHFKAWRTVFDKFKKDSRI